MNDTLSIGLLLLGVVWPLWLTLMLTFKGEHSLTRHLLPWAALPALVASLLVTPSDSHWFFPSILLGVEVGLDATGQVFLFFTALLWTVAGGYARAYFPKPKQRIRFYLFFMLAMAGNFSLILAQDLPSFYLGFTLMSFAAYGLIVFSGGVPALRAGRVYIVLVVVGELMLFTAMLMATQATGAITFDAVRIGLVSADNRDWIILLALMGFGIKVGVIGLHVWLPLAHPVAPTPASAVLSGAMLKAGLLGWLQLLPMGEMALPNWGVTMIILGLLSAFYGVAIGLTQRDPKTLLAYSSISQMGMITLLVGLGMLAPQVWSVILPAIAFYALHHGLSKGALFLGVGLSGSHHRLQRRWVWIGLYLPALALAGAPWTSGMLAKELVNAYTLYAPEPWSSLLPVLLSVSAMATALLMARLLYLMRPAAQPFGLPPTTGLVWPWIVLLLAILLVPWWLGSLLPEQAGSLLIIKSLWPIFLAMFVVWIVLKVKLFQSLNPIPAGDVWGIVTRFFQPLHRMVSKQVQACIQSIFCKVQDGSLVKLRQLLATAMAGIKQIEKYLARWSVASFLVMLVLIFLVG